MPRPSTRSTNQAQKAHELSCGSLVPQPNDIPITEVDTPDKIWNMVQVACDSNTGIFFFRHERRMYMRYIETD
jgi:hypothetical protein